MKIPNYTKNYSEGSLWKKIANFAGVAGKEVIEKVLILFNALKDKDTPTWAKGVIIAALGYFISPVDAIPDVVPFAGYADDLGALAAALGAVALHIKKEHVASARATLLQWFGGATPSKNLDRR
jgi:uncharacterized membrane protein YkvA (DUF1232 family)